MMMRAFGVWLLIMLVAMIGQTKIVRSELARFFAESTESLRSEPVCSARMRSASSEVSGYAES